MRIYVRSGCPVAQAPRFPVAELAVLREPRLGSFQKGRMNSSFVPGRIAILVSIISMLFKFLSSSNIKKRKKKNIIKHHMFYNVALADAYEFDVNESHQIR